MAGAGQGFPAVLPEAPHFLRHRVTNLIDLTAILVPGEDLKYGPSCIAHIDGPGVLEVLGNNLEKLVQ
jgi:hypothetical protein